MAFSLWYYSGSETGGATGYVLGVGRFSLPVLPLLVVPAASVFSGAFRRSGDKRTAANVVVRVGAMALVSLTVALPLGVNWLMWRKAAPHERLRRSLELSIPVGAAVAADMTAIGKYLLPIYEGQGAPRRRIALRLESVGSLASFSDLFAVARRDGEVWVVALSRRGTAFWDDRTQRLQEALRTIGSNGDMREVSREWVPGVGELSLYRLRPLE